MKLKVQQSPYRLKPVHLPFLLLSLLSHAQNDPVQIAATLAQQGQNAPRFMFYSSAEVLPFYKNTSPISTSFPYISTDTTTGITTYDTFKVAGKAPFSRFPVFTTLGIELHHKKNCFNFQFIVPCNYVDKNRSGNGCSFGYGRIFEKGIGKIKCFIAPFISFSYLDFRYTIGTIDNVNKYVTILGHTFEPTYTVTHFHPLRKEKITSQYVRTRYNMRYDYLRPEITISNDRKKRFFWAVRVGC